MLAFQIGIIEQWLQKPPSGFERTLCAGEVSGFLEREQRHSDPMHYRSRALAKGA